MVAALIAVVAGLSGMDARWGARSHVAAIDSEPRAETPSAWVAGDAADSAKRAQPKSADDSAADTKLTHGPLAVLSVAGRLAASAAGARLLDPHDSRSASPRAWGERRARAPPAIA